MNVVTATLKVVVMILLVSNSLFCMDNDPIVRTKSPIAPVAGLDKDLEEAIDKLFEENPSVPVQQAHPPLPKVLSESERSSVPQRNAEKTNLYDYDVGQVRGVAVKHPLHKVIREGNKDAGAMFVCANELFLKGVNPVSYNEIGMQPLHCTMYLRDEKRAAVMIATLKRHFENKKQMAVDFLKAIIDEDIENIIKLRRVDAHEVVRFFVPSFEPFPKIDRPEDYLKLSGIDEDDQFEREKFKAKNLLTQIEGMNITAIPTRSGIMPLTLAIEAKKFIITKKLIELGAPVNYESEAQQPLLLAIKSGNKELVEALLKRGAVVTPRS